ncbi:enoyl-CoA hydratase-related protein [Aestuariimicrobium sp. p3-SID1156]|uniref:enoyl-CoA hydratase/isomerase family protein n=1 Tax=Aestuariimicrobium sp. p3-SID1156 TaxID=2916038 RepID=UPI00223A91C8|nr:enoyl-CoA hydratase-related protein [Aestuariimicrobium sp. p3-SID1156]MCT1459470.1 enoyl-CoA hydratase-related protein [Aestuariimicrobium sp. p3-SID1156]
MSQPASDLVTMEVTESVAVVTVNRPPVNALTMDMQDRIGDLAKEIARTESIKSVVVTGEGRAFVAGNDITEMAGMSLADMHARVHPMQACFTAIAKLPKPVVAAINGYALGGGLELALCADYRIASQKARLGLPEVTLGIMPGIGGTQRLPRLIGPSRAKDLIFTGRHVDADEALAIGLVDEVVEPELLMDQAMAWALQFKDAASWALRWAKEAIDTGLETDLDTGLMIEATGFAALFSTEDRRTGMKSFLEEGPGKAVFRGR